MTAPLSVLLLDPIGREDWGGVETDMLRAAVGLTRRGHLVTAAGRDRSRFLSRLAGAGVETLPLALRRDFAPLDAIRVRRFARRHRAGVVLTKLNRGLRLCGLARLLGAGISVVHHQGLYEIGEGFRHRLSFRWVSRILTPARAIRERIGESGIFPVERVDWVPNGVDPERFAADAAARAAARERFGFPDGAVLVNTARLHDQKAHALLLRAFATLPGRPTLALAGRGRLEPELRALAAQLGIADRVRFLGHVDDVPDLLRASDVFVNAAHVEGMPNNVLEAMAAGLPIVATEVGDVGAMLDGGGAGRLVPPGDAAALAAALREVLESPGRGAELGAAARRRAREVYPVDRMLDGVEACLARATTRKPASPASPSAPPARKLAE